MRKLSLFSLLLVGACNWTDFDTRADNTWVHASDEPNIGSTDYGVALVGVSTQSTGGQLAVVSNDTPNYSTLDYSADGSAAVGPNPQKLGIHFIAFARQCFFFRQQGLACGEPGLARGDFGQVRVDGHRGLRRLLPSVVDRDHRISTSRAPDFDNTRPQSGSSASRRSRNRRSGAWRVRSSAR